MRRVVLQAVLGVLMTGAVVAQEAASPLVDLLACRVDDESIRLSFAFESSPCWEVSDPVITAGSGEPADAGVAIGMTSTADVCTQNIVIAQFNEALAIASPANALDVTVTTPDGAILGEATIAIAVPSAECVPPTQEIQSASAE